MAYVELDSLNKIIDKLGLQPEGPVQAFLTDTCYKHMDKYVPKDKGNLRKIVSLTSDSIVYDSNYAEYQYYGEREDGSHKVQNYTTPGTGPYWDKKMVSAEMKDVVEEVQAFINRGGN